MINSYIAIDLETTGIAPTKDRIIEIGAIRVQDGVETGEYSTFINPQMSIPGRITDITGIDNTMVAGAPDIKTAFGELIGFMGDLPMLGHNVIFDYSFLKCAAMSFGMEFERDGIDTLRIARRVVPELDSKRLEYLCNYFGIDPGRSHRAFDDARSARILYNRLYEINPADEGFEKPCRLTYSIKKKSPVTAAQLRYLKALISTYGIIPEVEIESLTKNDASRLIDRILSTYGRI